MYKMKRHSRIITGDETLTVKRFAGSPGADTVYVDGKPVPREETTFKIACNVQPLNGRDLLLVPEGDRFTSNFWVWTYETSPKLEPADLIRRDGVWFLVQSTEEWGSYTRSRIMQIDVGPEVVQPSQFCVPQPDDDILTTT